MAQGLRAGNKPPRLMLPGSVLDMDLTLANPFTGKVLDGGAGNIGTITEADNDANTLAYWPLHNNSLDDYSGSGLNLTGGGATLVSSGLELDGSCQPNITNAINLLGVATTTIEGMVSYTGDDNPASNETVFAYYSDSDNRFYVYLTTRAGETYGKMYVFCRLGAENDVVGPYNFTAGDMATFRAGGHFAVQVTPGAGTGSIEVWLEGTRIISSTSMTINAFPDDAANIHLGYSESGYNRLHGIFSEVRVSDTARYSGASFTPPPRVLTTSGLGFNGTGRKVTVADTAALRFGTSDFQIHVFATLAAAGGQPGDYSSLFGKGTGSWGGSLALWAYRPSNYAWAYGNAGAINASGANANIFNSSEHLFSVIRDYSEATLKVYVDGVYVAQDTSADSNLTDASDLVLGWAYNYRQMKGSIRRIIIAKANQTIAEAERYMAALVASELT